MSEMEHLRAALIKLDDLEAALEECGLEYWVSQLYSRELEEMRRTVTRRLREVEQEAMRALSAAL